MLSACLVNSRVDSRSRVYLPNTTGRGTQFIFLLRYSHLLPLRGQNIWHPVSRLHTCPWQVGCRSHICCHNFVSHPNPRAPFSLLIESNRCGISRTTNRSEKFEFRKNVWIFYSLSFLCRYPLSPPQLNYIGRQPPCCMGTSDMRHKAGGTQTPNDPTS